MLLDKCIIGTKSLVVGLITLSQFRPSHFEQKHLLRSRLQMQNLSNIGLYSYFFDLPTAMSASVVIVNFRKVCGLGLLY